MSTVTVVSLIGLFVGISIGLVGMACVIRLSQWEKHLRRTRIAVAYKNRWSINSPMIDWLKWAQSVEKDQEVKGHVVYKQGGTTIVVRKRLASNPSGETTTKTVKGTT